MGAGRGVRSSLPRAPKAYHSTLKAQKPHLRQCEHPSERWSGEWDQGGKGISQGSGNEGRRAMEHRQSQCLTDRMGSIRFLLVLITEPFAETQRFSPEFGGQPLVSVPSSSSGISSQLGLTRIWERPLKKPECPMESHLPNAEISLTINANQARRRAKPRSSSQPEARLHLPGSSYAPSPGLPTGSAMQMKCKANGDSFRDWLT